MQIPEFIVRFSLHGLYFHIAFANPIPCRRGVALGKGDFDGLHACAPGLSFV
jgi:hypothetical protein